MDYNKTFYTKKKKRHHSNKQGSHCNRKRYFQHVKNKQSVCPQHIYQNTISQLGKYINKH